MLENVSWEVFLMLLGIFLICYYGVLVIRYFRSDVSSLMLNQKKGGLPGMLGKNGIKGKRSSMDILYGLLAEMDRELMTNKGAKSELIQLLRQKIGHYGLPDSNATRKILMNHLLLSAKAGQVDLTHEDLLGLFGSSPN